MAAKDWIQTWEIREYGSQVLLEYIDRVWRHPKSLGIGFPDATEHDDFPSYNTGDWEYRFAGDCPHNYFSLRPGNHHEAAEMYMDNYRFFEFIKKVQYEEKRSVNYSLSQPETATNLSLSNMFAQQNIMKPAATDNNPYLLDSPQKLVAFHDALSDYVIAPLGRVNHLQGLMLGISLSANNVDTTEGRLKYDDFHHAEAFLRGHYPDGVIMKNSTSRGKNLTSFYLFVTVNQEFKAFVFASATNNFVSYVTPAHTNLIEDLNKYFLPLLPGKQFTVNTYNGGQMTPNKIPEEDTLTHDEFYPFIEDGVEKLFTDFYASRSRVMVFTGEPGTGKSSLMRSMLGHVKDKFVLLDDPSVYDDPKAFNDFLAQVMKMSADERVTLFLEEADKILREKTDGAGALERILSMASGVVEHNIKIVIASNIATVDELYPALVRGGRAFRVLQFASLTPEQGNKARAKAGLPAIDDLVKNETLASVLNFQTADEIAGRRRRTMGFMPG